MVAIILGGIGNGDWLPLLWIMLGFGVLIQIGDWGIHYFRKKRIKNLMREEQRQPDDDSSLFSKK